MSTKKITKEEFLNRCKQIHGLTFNYSNVNYKNLTTKIEIKCNKCDYVWFVLPGNHIGPRKSGCPECKRRAQIGKWTKTTETIIEEIKEAHGDKFLYDKLIYVNCNTKVIVGCKIHGYFEKWPNDLKNGSGCPQCAGNKITISDFFDQMNIKHTNFDFSKFEYISAKTKSTVICKIHGEFLYSPNGLKNSKPNHGCSKCSPMNQINTLVASGKIRHPDDIPEYEKYRKAVWKITNQQFVEFYYKINPDNLKRGPLYHLDHKYSIQQGWKNRIPPEIIGGWKNLQLIPAGKNRSKSNKCSVTLESIM